MTVCVCIFASFWHRCIMSSVPALLDRIFPHCVINSTLFGKKILNIKCVFDLLYNCCLKHISVLEEFIDL
jgi:hypothetical protein